MHRKTYASCIVSFLQSLKDGYFDICRQRKVLKILCRTEYMTVVTIHRDSHFLRVAEKASCYQTNLVFDLLTFFLQGSLNGHSVLLASSTMGFIQTSPKVVCTWSASSSIQILIHDVISSCLPNDPLDTILNNMALNNLLVLCDIRNLKFRYKTEIERVVDL